MTTGLLLCRTGYVVLLSAAGLPVTGADEAGASMLITGVLLCAGTAEVTLPGAWVLAAGVLVSRAGGVLAASAAVVAGLALLGAGVELFAAAAVLCGAGVAAVSAGTVLFGGAEIAGVAVELPVKQQMLGRSTPLQ